MTEEGFRHDKELFEKNNKTAEMPDEWDDNKIDLSVNTNWLKKIIGKTKQWLERLINKLRCLMNTTIVG